ncbi:DUF3343 domain-containing protein [Enterococcus sp. AZ103]|uniref:DUF3343 domain-containing protein n=1 Tax=Enterococcus sp. AZ103 TaxID=2774628 RepID=UPI003F295A4B
MEKFGVALFYSTHEAMKAEKIAKEAQLQARIIPTPEKIYASCGFSLKYPLENHQLLDALLKQAEVKSEGYYIGEQEGLKATYQKREED